MPQRVIRISELRDLLSLAYHHVKNTEEPIIIQRYKRQDVVMAPLWELRFLKEVEAKIRAGECPWEA